MRKLLRISRSRSFGNLFYGALFMRRFRADLLLVEFYGYHGRCSAAYVWKNMQHAIYLFIFCWIHHSSRKVEEEEEE